MYHSFEDLDLWKRACTLAVRIYEVLKDCRDYALRDQMQRAGVSIASNIAEGAERGGRDFIRFVAIALGSAAELRTQVYIAAKIGLVDKATLGELVSELKGVSKMLTGLAKALRSNVQKPKTEDSE
ncbi:MAG: four helix bundle protein [Gemmataceae bacterium]